MNYAPVAVLKSLWLRELLVEELAKIVAPDRETFVWLCQSDIELGFAAEVNEAADRLFGPLA